MNAMAVSGFNRLAKVSNYETRLQISIRRWTGALFFSAVAGTICLVFGPVIGIFSLIELLPAGSVTLSTLLIVFSFPFIGLAAHCMDKIGEAEKAIRVEHCREDGFGGGVVDADTPTGKE